MHQQHRLGRGDIMFRDRSEQRAMLPEDQFEPRRIRPNADKATNCCRARRPSYISISTTLSCVATKLRWDF